MNISTLPKGQGYMASPYSHSDPDVRAARARAVTAVASALEASGAVEVLYLPITISVGIELILGTAIPYEYRHHKKRSRAAIRASAYVLVVMLDGWDRSIGVLDEVSYAESLGKPVFYLDPETMQISTTPEMAAA